MEVIEDLLQEIMFETLTLMKNAKKHLINFKNCLEKKLISN